MNKIFIVLLTIIISCHRTSSIDNNIGKINSETYNLYSQILDSIKIEYKFNKLYIIDSTLTSSRLCVIQPAYTTLPIKYGSEIDTSIYQNLFSKISTSVLQKVLIDTSKLKSKLKIYPISFYKIYNESQLLDSINCILAFSNILYDDDHKWCIVYFETYFGMLNGSGQFIIFNKRKDVWQKISNINTWIS